MSTRPKRQKPTLPYVPMRRVLGRDHLAAPVHWTHPPSLTAEDAALEGRSVLGDGAA